MTMEPFAKTAALVQQGLEQGAYPSACLSVGIGPRVLCRRTFGHVTGHTLYDMASVSKILGATMIALRWLEGGQAALVRSGGAFLVAPADKADITILQLMTHTSGIPDHFLLQEECGSPEEVTQAILRHPLVQRPGGVPIYSCMGYILLGKILERIGGEPLDRLAQSWVFDPLDLNTPPIAPQATWRPRNGTRKRKHCSPVWCTMKTPASARYFCNAAFSAIWRT